MPDPNTDAVVSRLTNEGTVFHPVPAISGLCQCPGVLPACRHMVSVTQQRQKLERLCHYVTRSALGHKRLRRTPACEVMLQLKTPDRDGTTNLLLKNVARL